jgi:hypothetical protein
MMQFIDVSGVGNSGKSAVVDLLREVDGVFVPEFWFEFDLIRVPGGLLDLRRSLLEDWSPVRSHAAYHAFIDVVRKMGIDPAPWDLVGLLRATSQRYDRRFKGQFQALSLAFVKQFKVASYRAEWPYDGLRESDVWRFLKKILRRYGLRKNMVQDVLLLDGKDFDPAARQYLAALYGLIVPPDCDRVVLNNGFEPFNPRPGLDMLGARQIVVTRDPRDVYVSGLNHHNVGKDDANLLAFDNDGMNKSFLATDDLAVFVKRYRLYQEKVFAGQREDVLKVAFEHLILSPTAHIADILQFLGVDAARHSRPGTVFVPARSAKNVGVWRQYSRKDEIRYIENELRDYLVDV